MRVEDFNLVRVPKAAALFALACLCGCSTTRVTNPPRTATEQFLLSQAAIQAVEPVKRNGIWHTEHNGGKTRTSRGNSGMAGVKLAFSGDFGG